MCLCCATVSTGEMGVIEFFGKFGAPLPEGPTPPRPAPTTAPG